MNIKRVDNKPMVIQVKKRQNIHLQKNNKLTNKNITIKQIYKNTSKVKRNSHVRKIYRKYNRNSSDIKQNIYGMKNSHTTDAAKTKNNLNNRVNRTGDYYEECQENKSITDFEYKNNVEQNQYKIKKHIQVLQNVGNVGSQKALEELDGGKEIGEAIMVLQTTIQPVKRISQYTNKKGTENFQRSYMKKKIKNSINTYREELKNKTNLNKQKTGNKKSKTIKQKNVKKSFKIANQSSEKNPVYKKYIKNKKIALLLRKMKLNKENSSSISDMLKGIIISKPNITMQYIAKHIGVYLLGIIMIIFLLTTPIIATVTILYNSPFAIFLPALEEGETILTVLSDYEAEFNQKIALENNQLDGCEKSTIVYENFESDTETASNYYDVIAVYMVQYGVGETASIVNETSKSNLKKVFDTMNHFTTSTETIEIDGKSKITKVKVIHVNKKNYRDMMKEYSFTREEIEILEEIMKPENLAMLGYIYYDSNEFPNGNIQIDLEAGEIGSEAVKIALTKLGTPYSQEFRDKVGYYDCSSFMYYTYKQLEINLSFEGSNTAAQEAKWCYTKGYTVSFHEMKAGDLIFYSFKPNGRFMNINHVGMYCGNGKIVDASFSQQKVVYRNLYSKENIVLIGRPSMAVKNSQTK